MYYERMSVKSIDLVFALLAAANGVEGRLNRVLSNVKGVSFTEYFLLKQLQNCHKGSATRVELASAVHLTPSAVTRALKPLEKIGYVSTEKGQRDARQSIASLTDAGNALLDDAHRLVQDEIALLPLEPLAQSKTIEALDALVGIKG